MGVVELDGRALGKQIEVVVEAPIPADDVPDRARNEEILLFETQAPAILGVIVGIQDLGDVLGVDLLLDRAQKVAVIEILQVEFARRPSGPQPQRIDRVGLVTHDE